ncbi:MAG: mechanosensitive ion channel family protein [Myxococcota bacterium]|nr:mechanosensitive ion channel family protein [Myxococcota bacterium]
MNYSFSKIFPLALSLFVLLPPCLSHAQKNLVGLQKEICQSPRQTIDGLLYWQQSESFNLERAAACLDSNAALAERQALAQKLKALLDARGLFVKIESVPKDPNYRDLHQQAKYTLFPKHTKIYVEQKDGVWLWSSQTLKNLSSMYKKTFVFNMEPLLNSMPAWMQTSFMGLAPWQLLGLFILILAAVIVRFLIMFICANQMRRIMQRIGMTWAEQALSQVFKPVGTLAASGFMALFWPLLQLPIRLSQIGMLAIRVLAALSAVMVLYKMVDVLTAWLEDKAAHTDTKMDDQLVPLVRTALKIFLVAVGTIFVLQNLNVDVGGLLAGLGLGGLAFALAAKDTVANLFGSITIFIDRPFHIGDWVVADGTEGVIESVGFRSTRIRTFYNSLISMPNAKLADSVIDNYGARQFRRCKQIVGITYDTPPEKVQAFVEGIRAIIQANPHTRKDFYEIHFNGFGDFSLNILLYFFFETTIWSVELKERHNVMLEIMRLAEKLEVQFAFPTQTLHVESLSAAKAQNETKAFQKNELHDIVEGFGPDGQYAQPAPAAISSGFMPKGS